MYYVYFYFFYFLVFETVFLLESNAEEYVKVDCPRVCHNSVDHMISESSGAKEMFPKYWIKCCGAPKDCKLYRKDGSFICNGGDMSHEI